MVSSASCLNLADRCRKSIKKGGGAYQKAVPGKPITYTYANYCCNQSSNTSNKKERQRKFVIMKVSCLVLTTALSCLVPQCAAFAAPTFRSRVSTKHHSISEELGLPCEDECAAGSFPNLPESVHPGVLSGRAQMDLLNHAKANGKL
jgi:hypothetical protein